MKMYMVETISIFRHRYVVEATEADHAGDEVLMNDNIREFSQKHIDENITSIRAIDNVDYLCHFNEDNEYLLDWSDKQKFDFVNRIDYSK